jgi:hypothetical protein
MRAKCNISSVLEKSNAQEQGAIQVCLNDAPIINDEIKAEASFNNQEHPQEWIRGKPHSKTDYTQRASEQFDLGSPPATDTDIALPSSNVSSCPTAAGMQSVTSQEKT